MLKVLGKKTFLGTNFYIIEASPREEILTFKMLIPEKENISIALPYTYYLASYNTAG